MAEDLYCPLWSPWLGAEFEPYWLEAEPRTIVSRARCYVLWALLRQALRVEGEVWECGVYRGGTAQLLARAALDYGPREVRLFDSFEGLPQADAARDLHVAGEFGDTSVEAVREFLKYPAHLHKGFMPDTFEPFRGSRIAFAHLDVDLYRSVTDCLQFIWPRMPAGGVIVIDDYGFPSCPGAKAAVDEFTLPLVLSTGQAVLISS
jgi:O-methyltransferase